MSKKQFKFKRGIFQKLVISYIVFSVLVTISLVVCLLISAVAITGGDTDALSPYEIVDDSGNITNLNAVTNLGGWIEELDEDYRIIQVYGGKKTKQVQYTQDEIYSLISMEMGMDREYIGFMNPVKDENRYFVCIYPGDVMQIETTVLLNAGSDGNAKKWSDLFFVMFVILFLANCILMSLYLHRKIKKPLDELISGMERVQAGEKSVSLQFKTEKEFEQIRNTFNLMAERLEKEKKEKAEMVRKKNQLILELSHDIKTPTATIKSYANALEAGLVPKEKIRDYYRTIDMKADRITNLSEDMFMLLKMENADYQLQLEKTDLSELLRKICAEHYEEITDAGFEFEIDIPEEAYMGMVDSRLFTRVISNLLLNAKKYNQSGKCIALSIEKVCDILQINVLDDGEAINEGLVDNLFEAFVRGDKSRKSDGGTGLGLAISKAIMEKHQGSIQYQRLGNQNCFIVCLKIMNNNE